MTAKLIKGTEIREQILKEIAAEVAEIQADARCRPRPGDHPGRRKSRLHLICDVKIKTAERLGFHEIQDNQPATIQRGRIFWH